MKPTRILELTFVVVLPLAAVAQDSTSSSSRFKALKCPAPSLIQTWDIVDHDGANRKVEPYLSSLANGESATGMITSPPFIIESDKVTFTICGHDGEKGNRNQNYIALVDARKGAVLLKTPAPQNDAMQERSWDVRNLRGTQVRIELRDGNGGGVFAWMGVGRIDAGPTLRIDFRQGMPKGWAEAERKAEVVYEVLTGGVPFKRVVNAFTLIPKQGSVEIPCGFAAAGIYFLGGTAAGARPLETCGGIEIHYKAGSPEVFPLMCGFTLDDSGKLLSPSNALHLHPSPDPYQHYLVIKPRADVIDKIRLVASPEGIIPRITAITCETRAEAEFLMPLPATTMEPQEAAWIDTHGISADTLDLNRVMEAIRAAHKMPAPKSPVGFRKHRLDSAFRSEGLAIADFNGDGKPDIAAGNVYYAGPNWKMVPMLGKAKEFNRYGYSDAFLCFADDLNRDGKTDLIVVGFPGQETRWLENPGATGGVWKSYPSIAKTGNENPAYIDMEGDGRRELVFMSDDKCALAQPGEDPTQPWKVRVIANPGEPSAGHGLGVGDVNRDGRLDVLIPDGWWEGPATSTSSPWQFHAAKFFGGAQLCIADLDGDGDNDVLGSSPHDYGIAWCEQTPDGWKTHEIDKSMSQTHAIVVTDLNGDGLPDFVTGKRFWAHNGHDPGSFQPSVLCWFEQKRPNGRPEWTQHVIDAQSGVGLQFEVIDLNRDKRPDIVTANKNGVFYFEQVDAAEQARD
jgi:hypothetical protein